MRRKKRNVVYSTADPDFERVSPEEPKSQAQQSLPPAEQTATIQREKRGGKQVTVIRNLSLTDADMGKLAKKLKKVCGSGGTVKEGAIEIQGDARDRIAKELEKQGYQTKFAGG